MGDKIQSPLSNNSNIDWNFCTNLPQEKEVQLSAANQAHLRKAQLEEQRKKELQQRIQAKEEKINQIREQKKLEKEMRSVAYEQKKDCARIDPHEKRPVAQNSNNNGAKSKSRVDSVERNKLRQRVLYDSSKQWQRPQNPESAMEFYDYQEDEKSPVARGAFEQDMKRLSISEVKKNYREDNHLMRVVNIAGISSGFRDQSDYSEEDEAP